MSAGVTGRPSSASISWVFARILSGVGVRDIDSVQRSVLREAATLYTQALLRCRSGGDHQLKGMRDAIHAVAETSLICTGGVKMV